MMMFYLCVMPLLVLLLPSNGFHVNLDMTARKVAITMLASPASVAGKVQTSNKISSLENTTPSIMISFQTSTTEPIKSNKNLREQVNRAVQMSASKVTPVERFLSHIHPTSVHATAAVKSRASPRSVSMGSFRPNSGKDTVNDADPSLSRDRKADGEAEIPTQVFDKDTNVTRAADNNVTGTAPCNRTENHCLNGATCFKELGVVKCRCPTNYDGRFCENHNNFAPESTRPCNMEERQHLPCLNDGKCFVENSQLLCRCKGQFAGRHCHEVLLDTVPSAGHKRNPDQPRPPKSTSERPDPWPNLKPTVDASNKTNSSCENYSLNSSSGNRRHGRKSSIQDDKPHCQNITNSTSIKTSPVGWFASEPTTAKVVVAIILFVVFGVVLGIGIYVCRRRSSYDVVRNPEETPPEQREVEEIV